MAEKAPTNHELEALAGYFSKKGWDERVPGMLNNWGREPLGAKFECGDGTFELRIWGERATRVYLLWERFISVAREGESNLRIEGRPVGRIWAVKEKDSDFYGEEELRISLPDDNLMIKVKRSGVVELAPHYGG